MLAGHLGWLHNSRTGLSRVSVASFDNRRDLANCPAGQSPLPLGRLLRKRSGAELVEFYCHLGQSGCETFGYGLQVRSQKELQEFTQMSSAMNTARKALDKAGRGGKPLRYRSDESERLFMDLKDHIFPMVGAW